MSALDDRKFDLIARATDLALHRKGSGGPPHDEVGPLLMAYYRHVAPEDVVDRSEVDLYGALASHYKLAETRPQGRASVRVFTPNVSANGWSANGHTVVEVITDDMPFLVDSITMELGNQQRNVHVVVHPQFEVERDIAGELKAVRSIEDGARLSDTDGGRESWMHIEIDRVPDEAQAAAIKESLLAILRDVREAIEDWEKMRDRILDIVVDLQVNRPPCDYDEVDQASDLLRWLADDHFTFLGYREYRLERVGDDDYLRAVPGSGLGILRADQNMTGDFGKLPPLVQAKAREKTVLVLAKANSRSTIHRPAYLDYVGIKTFDENGEVNGERRFLGLFSSAAYTESLTRIPMLREKAAEVLRRVGFDPRSHAGKSLMDTLENYPRDELFQAPVEELAPIAEAVMYTRERRQLRLFARRDAYGRYLSVQVYLPRDRYNTSVREKFAEILSDRLGGDSVEFTARVNESTTARVSFVVRPPRGEMIGEVDLEDLEHRLVDAARSWPEDFMTAVVAEYGEESGSRLGRA